MFIFPTIFMCILLLSSCMSEVKEPELHPSPEICCKQSIIGKIQEADSTNIFSRGWEGEVGPYDAFPSIIYPLDYIYLMVENPSSEEGWEVMPIHINKFETDRYFEICYHADQNDNYNIYATNEGNSIKIGPNKRCFFSSIPNIQTGIVQSPTIKTPGGKVVYEPYGDKLFRSEYISFSFNKKENTIYSQLKNKEEIPVDQRDIIDMYRGTSVIIPRLVICDDYPKWVEGQPIFTGSSELKIDKFNRLLGSLDDWEVRFFLAGKKRRTNNTYDPNNNYPVNLNMDYFEQKGAQTIIGKVSGNNKGIVAITEDAITMHSIQKVLEDHKTGSTYTYKGFGVHDGSFPFLYDQGNSNNMILCCSLYYHNPKTLKTETRTLRFPLDFLYTNQIHTITYVIDVDDVAKEFGLPQTNSRNLRHEYDEDFGDIANIPTTIINTY